MSKILTPEEVAEIRKHAPARGSIFFSSALMRLLDSHEAIREKLATVEDEALSLREEREDFRKSVRELTARVAELERERDEARARPCCVSDQVRAVAAEARVAELEELHRMQECAISVAAQCNTPESAAQQRIEKGNPYWTLAYSDVCAAVDREMILMKRVARLAAVAVVAKALDWRLRDYIDREPDGVSWSRVEEVRPPLSDALSALEPGDLPLTKEEINRKLKQALDDYLSGKRDSRGNLKPNYRRKEIIKIMVDKGIWESTANDCADAILRVFTNENT